MIEAEAKDRIASLRMENASLASQLRDARGRVAELEAQVAATTKGECPVCEARRKADALKQQRYRKRKRGLTS